MKKPKISHRKSAERRKTDVLRMRVTATEKALFTEAASKAGLDMSEWARVELGQAARRPTQPTEFEPEGDEVEQFG